MPALADTIEAALVRAYQNNPQLNAQRAQVRFTDENVPQALSGYRPKVAITASAGYQYTDTLTTCRRHREPAREHPNSRRQRAAQRRRHRSRRTCSTASKPPTRPARRKARFRARAKVCGCSSRRVLLSAATIYMDYLRDSAIVEVQKSNVRVLEQTLKQTQGPVQCRRSDAHRRRAVGGTTRRRQDATADCRSQSGHDAIELPPHHRQ